MADFGACPYPPQLPPSRSRDGSGASIRRPTSSVGTSHSTRTTWCIFGPAVVLITTLFPRTPLTAIRERVTERRVGTHALSARGAAFLPTLASGPSPIPCSRDRASELPPQLSAPNLAWRPGRVGSHALLARGAGPMTESRSTFAMPGPSPVQTDTVVLRFGKTVSTRTMRPIRPSLSTTRRRSVMY